MIENATIVLVATNIGQNFGGEAIKAWQYAHHLKAEGRRLLIISHERCRGAVAASFAPGEYRLLPDDRIMLFLWRTRPLRTFMNFYFHWQVRRLIRRERLDPARHVLHYIAPISPVAVRLPPRSYRVVMGPLSGNIYYPPAFQARMGGRDRLRARMHRVTQWLMGRIFGDKKRADVILNSGYERTRASLLLAGCNEERIIDVMDSGIGPTLSHRPRIRHAGKNFRFVAIGRLIDVKANDLAIRAIGQADPRTTLDIWGKGDEQARLEALTRELGLEERVTFHGWLAHDDLAEACAQHRGFIFPSLAESNGIVMQEAMMLGLPVVALRWGGPAMLANDDSAIYITPESETHVVAELARAMDRLATDGTFADAISARARSIAETHFPWDVVARSWETAYHRL